MDRYKCLEAFVHVAEMGSVSRAAQALNVSKSVVSERISQLEALVGRPLLVRTTRSVTLSEAGAAAYPVYADLVARLGDMGNSLGAAPDQLTGRLRVASVIDIGVTEIATHLSKFLSQNPALCVELVVGNSMVNPVDDGFDVTLHYRQLATDRVTQEIVGSLPIAPYASPAYLAVHGVPTSPEELRDHRCLGYSQQVTVNDWNSSEWQFVFRGKMLPVKVALAARSNSGLVLRQLAVDGHGIAVLPRLRAQECVRAGSLVELMPEFLGTSLKLYASFPATQRDTLKITRFIEALKAGFAPLGEQPPL